MDEAASAAETLVFQSTLAASRGGQGPTQRQRDLARKLRGQANTLYQLASFVAGDEPLTRGGLMLREPWVRGNDLRA